MKYKTSYIYIRLTPELKAKLKSEAALAEVSINTYVVTILRYRKKVIHNLGSNEGNYYGF